MLSAVINSMVLAITNVETYTKKKSIDMETKGHSLAHYFSRQTTIIRSWPLWYTKWPNLWRNLEGQF